MTKGCFDVYQFEKTKSIKKCNNKISNYYYINEIGHKQYPNDTIGAIIPFSTDNIIQIAGYIKDFKYKSLREPIEPLAIYITDYYTMTYINIRISSDFDQECVKESIIKTINSIQPEFHHNIRNYYDEIPITYCQEFQNIQLIILLSLISIFIAFSGIIGIVLTDRQSIIYEINIRKIYGAENMQLFISLSSKYTKLISIALIPALTISFYTINSWLNLFYYHISMPISSLIIGIIIIYAAFCILIAMQIVIIIHNCKHKR